MAGPVDGRRSVKIYSLGVLSIKVRVKIMYLTTSDSQGSGNGCIYIYSIHCQARVDCGCGEGLMTFALMTDPIATRSKRCVCDSAVSLFVLVLLCDS